MSQPEKQYILTELDLSASQSGNRLYLQTGLIDEGKEGLTLELLDEQTVWEGALSENDLDRQCTEVKMDFNSYVSQTVAALTQENKSDLNFECHFKILSSDTAQITWKKSPAHDIKFHLGSVKLKKSKNSTKKICDILSQCITHTQFLQTQIKSLETDNERLTLERQNALKRLDKCVTAKEEMEKDLYSKFVAVLNSKKERIRILEDELISPSNDGVAYSPVASTSREENSSAASKGGGGVRNGTKHKADSDLDGFDMDEESPPPKNRAKGRTKASQNVEKMDWSINLGEEEEEEEKSAPVARRPRKAATKKETPGKPVLPRVTSGNTSDRPSSAGKRSSLRKSGSGNSNKSSDNLDPDDLLDKF